MEDETQQDETQNQPYQQYFPSFLSHGGHALILETGTKSHSRFYRLENCAYIIHIGNTDIHIILDGFTRTQA
jgi:hypothetical protein